MTQYKVHEAYHNNDDLRNKFFEFTQTVFPGADFKKWYLKGFWLDKYIPFSIVEDDKIISNVSISKMDLLIDSKFVNGMQFGTVGTIPEYRNRGLSRYLMEYVLEKYKDSIDFSFLFANESVLDFYPKFGFKRQNAVIFKSTNDIPKANFSTEKLNLELEDDFKLIQKMLMYRLVITRLFGAMGYEFITMWHILNIFPNCLYYLEDDDIIFIISETDGHLHVWDVIYTKPFDISSALSKVIENDNLKSIRYYFSPDQIKFKYDEVENDEDSPLFVRGDFPIVGKEAKFPATAYT
jgi:predicted N-acetyltransferase YhbS